MAFTSLENDRVGQSYTPSGSNTPASGPTVTVNGDTPGEFSAIVPHATTDAVIETRFRIAKLQSCILQSTGAAVSLSNGTDAVSLTAGQMVIWIKPAGGCPFTVDTGCADANELKITNADPAIDATVYLRFMQKS